MRVRARRVLRCAIAAAAAFGIGVVPGLTARPWGSPADIGTELASGAMLATPEQVLQQGGTGTDAEAQGWAWSTLSPVQRHQQTERRDDVDRDSPTLAPPLKPTPVDCDLYRTVDGAGTTAYQVAFENKTNTRCYAGGAGIHELPTDRIGMTDVRTGNFTGRVYYRRFGVYYWSPVHGPDQRAWHAFTSELPSSYYLVRVQLLSGPGPRGLVPL